MLQKTDPLDVFIGVQFLLKNLCMDQILWVATIFLKYMHERRT